MDHKWSGWPGAFCLNCGQENVGEQALVCELDGGGCIIDQDKGVILCAEHEEQARRPCSNSPVV